MRIAKVAFTKKQLKQIVKVSRNVLFDPELNIGTEGRDFVNNELTYCLNSWFLEHLSETRTLTYLCERPKFTDWLFRKRKKVEFKLDVKDLLLNPPVLKDKTIRTYEIELIDPSIPSTQDCIDAAKRQIKQIL